jgi:hypothetical protein
MCGRNEIESQNPLKGDIAMKIDKLTWWWGICFTIVTCLLVGQVRRAFELERLKVSDAMASEEAISIKRCENAAEWAAFKAEQEAGYAKYGIKAVVVYNPTPRTDMVSAKVGPCTAGW